MIDMVNGAASSAIIYSIAETAKANNLKSFDYFEYLLTEIQKHTDFLADLLPWSDRMPENIRKLKKAIDKFSDRKRSLIFVKVFGFYCYLIFWKMVF